MGKRDGDARRMLTEVSGSPAVAPIKSIHQYFSLSLSLGAGRMRVGFLVPKKKGRNKKRVDREARSAFDCRCSSDLWITLAFFFFLKKNRQKFQNFMTTPPRNPFIFSKRKKKKKKIIIYYYKMKSIWWVGVCVGVRVCVFLSIFSRIKKRRSDKLFVHIH